MPKEKTLSDLVSGDTFILGKEKYRLMQVFADRYQVVKLKTVKNQVAPKKYVDAEVGVEIHDMLGDTVIE